MFKRTFFAVSFLVVLGCSNVASEPTSKTSTPPLTRIAFGSCAHQDKPQPIWDAVLRYKPELFVFLGDNVYADTFNMQKMRASYARLGAQPGYQALAKTTPIVATWDDHDYGQNDAGREYPYKTEAKGIFLDFFKEPKASPRWKRSGIYTSYLYGPPKQRVQVILLDLRTFRTSLKTRRRTQKMMDQYMGPYIPTDDKEATMLGEAQWAWLETQLKTPANIRLIGVSTQFLANFNGWEAWSNMPAERQRMLDLIKKTRASGTLFISGDTHWAELSTEKEPGLFPLYDLTSSGLTEVWRGVAPNQRRIGKPFLGANFGGVVIKWSQDPEITLEVLDVSGTRQLHKTFRLSTLSMPK